MELSSLKLFNTRNLYVAIEVTPDSLPREIRAAGYRLIMENHPDHSSLSQSSVPSERCLLVWRILRLLTNGEKRKAYDLWGECADLDNSDDGVTRWGNLLRLCGELIKSPEDTAYNNFRQNYKGSQLEIEDIKAAYRLGRGCMDHVIKQVPLMTARDEPRIRRLIAQGIRSQELPSYRLFQNETATKRKRRHKKYGGLGDEEKQNRVIDRMLDAHGDPYKVLSEVLDAAPEGDESGDEDDSSIEADPNQLMDQLMTEYGEEVKAVLQEPGRKVAHK